MTDKSELAQGILFAGAGVLLGTAVAALASKQAQEDDLDLKKTDKSEGKHVGFQPDTAERSKEQD